MLDTQDLRSTGRASLYINALVNSFDRAAVSSGEVIEGRSETSIVPPYATSYDNFLSKMFNAYS